MTVLANVNSLTLRPCLLLAVLLSACTPRSSSLNSPPPKPVADPPAATSAPTLQSARDAVSRGALEEAEQALRALERSSAPEVRIQAIVECASLFESQLRHRDAAEAWARAAAESQEIAPYCRLHEAESRIRAGDASGALPILRAIAATAPGSAAANGALIRIPAVLAQLGDEPAMNASMNSLTSILVDSFTEAELAESATRLEDAGQLDAAGRVRYSVLRRNPRGRFTETLYRDPSTAAIIQRLDFTQSLELADALARVNRNDQALDLIEKVLKRFPESSTDPNLVHLRIRTLFSARRYESVVALRQKPDEPYYLAIELMRGRASWRIDKSADFLATLANIIRNYPKSDESFDARLLLAKYYVTDQIDFDLSIRYLREVIASNRFGNDGENIWTLGWMQLMAGRDADAVETFNRYLRSWPDADYTTNVLFWLAKTQERNGNLAERNALFSRLIGAFPYSYYSYRAREIEGVGFQAAVPAAATERLPAFVVQPGTPLEARLRRVLALESAGMMRDAARELRLIERQRPDDRPLAWHLADLYARVGEPARANALLQRHFRGIIRHGGVDVPQRFWEILYPRDHWMAIEEAARRSSVDPFLVAAIIRQESGFESMVVSNAGAVGLMQIMPAEAARIASLAGLSPASREALFDPSTNISFGSAEFRIKLDLMRGHPSLAIASYNAGELAVARWSARRSPEEDLDTFIESIPYAETRLYVKNVTRNLNEYRRVYGGI